MSGQSPALNSSVSHLKREICGCVPRNSISDPTREASERNLDLDHWLYTVLPECARPALYPAFRRSSLASPLKRSHMGGYYAMKPTLNL
eukprot:1315541-Amphidinium_carterae.2